MKEEWAGHGISILTLMILSTLFTSAWSATQNPFPQAILFPSLMIAGVTCIFIARIPLYKQKKFWSFGPSKLPDASRKWYWSGYLLFGVGMLWTLLFVSYSKTIQRDTPNTHSPSALGDGGR